MSVRGIFTSDAGIEGTRRRDFASALLMIMPQGTAPLLALTSGMMNSQAKDTITTWFEENYLSGRVTCSMNMLAGSTELSGISDIGQMVVGQILMVEDTSEYMLVTGVDEANSTISVIRGFTETTPTPKDGSATAFGIQRIGTAHEEASSAPAAVANRGYPRLNAIQTFRNSWNVSGLAQQIEYYTGSIEEKSKADCVIEHAADIERSLIWGRMTFGTKNGKNFYTMNGIRYQLTSNIRTAAGGNVSYKILRNFLQRIFERNIKGKPNERIAFCGNSVINALDDITRADSDMNVTPGVTEFGLNVWRLITPHGNISLMTHPMMVESPLWTRDMMVLHPGAMEVRWLRRQVWDNYNSSGSRGGVDADYGVVTSDLTCCYKAEATGGYYSGVTGGIAS